MTLMRTISAWLIIRNGDELRIVTRRPNLLANEVAVNIIVKLPQPPRVVATVNIQLPEPPPILAEATVTEYGPAQLEGTE